jgi:hypothetical protein
MRIDQAKRIALPALLVVCVMSFVLWPHVSYGLVRPSSLGLDDETLVVKDPSQFKAMGMADVKRGDRISIGGAPDKRVVFTNNRTGETLTYPPRVEKVPKKP